MGMTKSDLNALIFSILIGVPLGLFLLANYSPHFNGDAQRPDHATAFVEVVKPINDVAAVVLVKAMQPHSLPTIAGDAEITRGSEIYIKAPDSLRNQLRIDPASRHIMRCIQISPDDYGWKVRNVFTRHECQNRHYE